LANLLLRPAAEHRSSEWSIDSLLHHISQGVKRCTSLLIWRAGPGALTGGLVLCLPEFAGAQGCMGGAGGGGAAAGTGLTTAGINVDTLQAQQFMLQMQQLQAEAMRQQAMQMMLAAQRNAAQAERAQPCTQRMDNVAGSAERVATMRDTGDRFASQRASARLRQVAIAVRIANRDAELQRRRDRAAAGR
jgi:hypothetical protein